jgi:hypothetical protein
LPRLLPFAVGQVPGLLQQIVGESHRSRPSFLFQSSLFGLAPELEIREQSPLFDGLECLHDSISNAPGDLQQPRPSAGTIRKQDAKEDRVVTGPILAKRVAHADHIRSKRAHYIAYGCVQSASLRDSAGYVHDSIITQIIAPCSGRGRPRGPRSGSRRNVSGARTLHYSRAISWGGVLPIVERGPLLAERRDPKFAE